MTVSSTTTRVSFSGDGSTTVFAYTFKIFDDDDITVILRSSTGTETVQTKTTDYSVSGVGNTNGGNVTMVTAPATGETLVLRRTSAQTQTTDYVANDPFPAATHEDALDKLTFLAQEQQEELDRAIKISRTNTMTSTEFTVGATDRANKILAFDSSGEIQVTQEIGTFRGNWAASTAYEVRDLVKDTSTNNIFIVNAEHTSSGAQPLTTNANSAKYDLIVDAASATTSATNAATSETNAGTSETNAAASAASALSHKNDAETAKTASEAAQTASEAAQTAAEAAQTAAEAALDTFDDRFLGAKASDPTVDNDGNALIDGALYFDTTNDIMKVYDLTNTQWRQLTLTSSNQTNVNTVAGQISPTNNIATVAARDSDIGTVAARDTDIGTVASRDTDIGTVAAADTNIGTVASNITDVNNFADTYFISANAPSDPTLGDLWFDTTNNIMKVYGSGGFVNAGSNVNGTANRYNYVVGTVDGSYDGSTTVFPASYDSGYVDVYLNGAKLVVTSDFTATNGTSVTLGTAANTGDVVDIVGYGTFTAATALSLGDNEKIQLGAAQDMQLFHDGSDSLINDAGTGSLKLQQGGNTKLEVTSTGIDVTGTATADQLDVDNIRIDGNTISSTDTNGDITLDPNGTGDTIVASGNLGVGTTSPDASLHIEGSGVSALRFGSIGPSSNSAVRLSRDDTTVVSGNPLGYLEFGGNDSTSNTDAAFAYVSGEASGTHGAGDNPTDLTFGTTADGSSTPAERVRITDGGALFVGKTARSFGTAGIDLQPAGDSHFTASNQSVASFNRLTSNGEFVAFYQDSTAVAKIGGTSADALYIGTPKGSDSFIRFDSNYIAPSTSDGSNRDNVLDWGYGPSRWDDIFATNGTINTSDQNEKEQIASLTTAEITAAKAISKLFKTFKWQDKVAAKGDAARTHTGVIAQEVQTAMTAAGLNAAHYAFWCSDTWWEADETYTDDDGVEQTRTNTYDTADEAPEGATQRTRLGIRYPELLAFIGAATEQRLADIETRLTALENAE